MGRQALGLRAAARGGGKKRRGHYENRLWVSESGPGTGQDGVNEKSWGT